MVRGFGDVVARVTKWFGVAPCAPCEQRREALNRALPNPFAKPTPPAPPAPPPAPRGSR